VPEPTEPCLVLELTEQFIDAKIAAGLSPKTISTYRQRLGYFTAWLCDREVTRAVLRAYLKYLHEQPTLTATSRASYFRDVSVFCNWLVEERIWDTSPAYKLAPKVPKRLPASYRQEQIAAMLAVCGPRDRALITMLLDTGLRVGELCSLRRDAIVWVDGSFRVVGKGNKERHGWLHPYTMELLRVYLDSRDDDDPALWMGRKGPLTIWGVHQIVERRAESVGIRGDVRRLVHSFRATFAKNYIKAGGDLESLRRLLGHEDIAMSAHYAQLADDELADRKRQVNPLGFVLPAAAD
jgi:integrase/recombinase XerD